MEAYGKTRWAIPGCHIPLQSNGHEPEMTSRDQIAILNTGDKIVHMEMMIIYEDREPVGPYKLAVKARRVRKVRFNDLIDPFAIPLDTPFGVAIEADHPVIIQFFRMNTSSKTAVITGWIAFPLEEK